jgi:hypothetical protein
MPDIQITFRNLSNDRQNRNVLIFQKNTIPNYSELDIAWRVIQNCPVGGYHPFVYPMLFQVSAEDSYGNFTARLDASNGQRFQMSNDGTTGDAVSLMGPATDPNEVQIANNLGRGSFNANIFKDGKLLARKTNVVPNDFATFQFLPKLWVGTSNQVVQGEEINSAVLAQVNTQIDLFGIVSCDIVMRGGGSGQNAQPITFTRENVVLA